jgi:hypothetical protein
VIIAAIITFLATAMAVPFVMDWFGLPIVPVVSLASAIGAAGAVGVLAGRAIAMTREETIGFVVVCVTMFAWLAWIAWPSLLPQGRGPDLAHHLMLVDYIDQHWRLPHDPALGRVFGEMLHYTPGVHLLASTAGAWTRSDGLHAIYPVVALTVAIKAGLVFLIAMRVLPPVTSGGPTQNGRAPNSPLGPAVRAPVAVAASLLLFVPREYFLRSFIDASFLAQVVSECFAVAMWWAVVLWDERPSAVAAGLFAIAGIGVFLSWPVWLGPLVIVFAVVVALHGRSSRATAGAVDASQTTSHRDRLRNFAIGVVPIAVIAAMYAARHAGAATIIAVAGYVPPLRVEFFGPWFLALAALGLALAAFGRETRTVVWLVGAIVLQSAALAVLARDNGADRPYQALKMMYLLIYPLAVAAAIGLGKIGGIIGQGRMGGMGGRMGRPVWLAWLVVAALTAFAVVPVVRAPGSRPVATEPLFEAGVWARDHLPRACVDYLVSDDYSAYWLHVAVLRNARSDANRLGEDLFEAKKGVVRWILPEGLPFAIAENFDALPKDIRANVDVLARFGPAAVIKRRGRSTCPT